MRLFLLSIGLAVLQAATLLADYRDDIGYTRLLNEKGPATPSGTGVLVTHVEAPSGDLWMPDKSDAEFDGKTIVDKTGSSGATSHATGVGRRFYGNSTSIAPAIVQIDVYETNDWLQTGYLGYGYVYGGRPFQPVYNMTVNPWIMASPARVANHSWVGSLTGAVYNSKVLRRLDFAIASDDYTQITAIGNSSSSNNPLLNHAFNSITVGRTDGSHPVGTLDIDTVYVPNRTCPLVVVPLGSTSSAAPVVAAAAALLIETGRDPALSNDPVEATTFDREGVEIHNAERSEVIKAAILAGAQRVTHNTSSTDQISDYQSDSTNGLDQRYGAGQININNSYDIIAAGEQNSAEDEPADSGTISAMGFDVDPAFGGGSGSNTTGSYYFTPAAHQRRLYACLTWHLHVDGGSAQNYVETAMLYDLNLTLYDVTVSGDARLVAASSSTVDNTENLWAALVPDRNYRMEVNVASGQVAFSWDYGLAWRMETPPDTDVDGIPDDWEVQNRLDYTRPEDAELDPDNDGLTNLQEFENGTDMNQSDTDGDGQLDGIEVLYFSDPLNPGNTATIPAIPATNALPPYLLAIAVLVMGWKALSVPDKSLPEAPSNG